MSAQNDVMEFTTAVAENTKKPLKVRITTYSVDDDGNYLDPETGNILDEDADPIQTVVTLRLDPRLNFLQAQSLLGGLQRMAQQFNAKKVMDGEGDFDTDEVFTAIRELTKIQQDEFRKIVVPPDRAKFDSVREDLDTRLMGQMMMSIIGRMTAGMDPTGRTSSDNGASATGEDSKPGASPEESD